MSESRDNGDLRKLFSGYEPTKRTKGRGSTIGARTAFPVHVTVEQGKEVFEYATLHFSAAELEVAVAKGNVRLPHGFWTGFPRNCVKRTPSRALSDRYRKAFKLYVRSLNQGVVTVCGMMGAKKRGQRRAIEGS